MDTKSTSYAISAAKNERGGGTYVLYSKDVYEQFKLVCRCRALTHVNLLKLMGPG